MPTENTPKPTKRKYSKREQDAGILTVWMPRPILDAIDLRSQYDRSTKTDVVREWLWTALRLSTSTDSRFRQLLGNNGIDISPVNLRPKRESEGSDPTELI